MISKNLNIHILISRILLPYNKLTVLELYNNKLLDSHREMGMFSFRLPNPKNNCLGILLHNELRGFEDLKTQYLRAAKC